MTRIRRSFCEVMTFTIEHKNTRSISLLPASGQHGIGSLSYYCGVSANFTS